LRINHCIFPFTPFSCLQLRLEKRTFVFSSKPNYTQSSSLPMKLRPLVVTGICFSILSIMPLGAQDFRVQVAAYADSVSSSYFKSRGVEGVVSTVDQMGMHRYFYGSYQNREQAEQVQKQLVDKGFPFASIIDLEEQRILCGANCPYFRNDGAVFVQDKNRSSTLRNIYFDFGRSNLSAASKAELDVVAQSLREHPTMRLKLLGYTDAVGSAENNILLATTRARAARNYLINKGVRADRMYIKVFGEYDPEAPNEDFDGKDVAENRKRNRRVVLAIVDEAGEVKTNKDLGGSF